MIPRAAWAVAFVALLAAMPAPLHARPASAAAPAAPTLVTDALPVPVGEAVAPLAPSTPIDLAITLAFSNQSRLDREVAAVQDPRSPEYRHFVTSAEFNAEFAPSAGSVAAVERSLRSAGATGIYRTAGGLTLDAVLPAAGLAAWLSVEPVQTPGTSGYTVLGRPMLPAGLSGLVAGIDGLSSAPQPGGLVPGLQVVAAPTASGARPQFVEWGSTGIDWYIGTDYAQAYGAAELLPGNASSVPHAAYPTGVAIATLLASGYNEPTSTSLPPWDPAVVDAYFNETFPSGWPLPSIRGEPVPVPGEPLPPAPGPSGGLADSFNYVTENALDLEMAGSLAPGASLYNFYFNSKILTDPFASSLEAVAGYLADDLGAALNYTGYGGQRLAAVSCSFGLPDVVSGQWDAELTKAAAMGVSVLGATGDQGDAPEGTNIRNETAAPLWPATVAFNTSGVIAVGGESVVLSGTPTGRYTGLRDVALSSPYDATVGGISSAVAWSNGERAPDAYAGTEGGTTLNYSEPYWQFHSAAQPPIVNATEREGYARLGRAEPDVAFAANDTIAYNGTNATGAPTFVVLEGTSIAAPVFAGLLADVVAVENASAVKRVTGVGFIDPTLYRIASYYAQHPSAAGDPFRAVAEGRNYEFAAAPGWNPTTGWGSLSGPLLLKALANSTLVNYTYTGPTPGLPTGAAPPLSTLAIIAIAGAAVGVVILATVALSASRRRPAPPPVDPFAPIAPTLPAAYAVRPPTAPFATFSCPYCGAPRPSEPGHCPNCGAM